MTVIRRLPLNFSFTERLWTRVSSLSDAFELTTTNLFRPIRGKTPRTMWSESIPLTNHWRSTVHSGGPEGASLRFLLRFPGALFLPWLPWAALCPFCDLVFQWMQRPRDVLGLTPLLVVATRIVRRLLFAGVELLPSKAGRRSRQLGTLSRSPSWN
jgi:hypothetical protein